jgi:hypothetical protein
VLPSLQVSFNQGKGNEKEKETFTNEESFSLTIAINSAFDFLDSKSQSHSGQCLAICPMFLRIFSDCFPLYDGVFQAFFPFFWFS